jgi:divalent metal cation (Fe/Co/Zn/Cd) transporter
MPWLKYADALAGLSVAAVILWVGGQLGRRTVDALLDAAPEGLQREISSAVRRMEGVLDVERVRVRRAGNRHFVDATVSVARTASLEQVHALSDAIENRIGEIVPSDVMVHTEPRAPRGEHFFEAIRATAQRMGLSIHDLSAQQLDEKIFVELHLEVDENLSLTDAHRKATELEDSIRRLRDSSTDVNIHIEPLGRRIATPDAGVGSMSQLETGVDAFLNGLSGDFPEIANCHDVRVRQVEHHILVSCHCTIKGALSITKVHDIMAVLESRVKEKFPQIYRINIHPEPLDEK